MLSVFRAPRMVQGLASSTQVRTLKKGTALRKPYIRLKFDFDGNPKIPEVIRGWDHEQREKFMKWMMRTSAKIAKDIGQKSGDRFTAELKRSIEGYIASYWGLYMSKLKAVVRVKRSRNRKLRRNRLFYKKINQWQKLEDFRENKILRDRARLEREARHEPFSMNNFLRAERRALQSLMYADVDPTLTEKEEIEFIAAAVEADRDQYLFKPPKSVRRVYHPDIINNIGYEKRLNREIVDPWVYEIRRKARAADLVARYEESFARARWLAKRRQERIEQDARREKEWLQKREHWHKVLGDWHAEQNRVRALQAEVLKRRTDMYAKARHEFLHALADDVAKWVETPSECRYLRFRFASGVKFPFNKSHYM